MGQPAKILRIDENNIGISAGECPHPLYPDNYERFCQLYVIDFNGAKAYREAGFGIDLKKKKANVTASAAAWQLLKNIKIQERIRYLSRQHKQTMLCNAGSIKQMMVDTIAAQPSDFVGMDDEGKLVTKPMHMWTNARLIQEIESDGQGKIKIKLMSKDKAIEHLAKIEKLLVDSHEISGELMVVQQVEANEAYKMRLAKLSKMPKMTRKSGKIPAQTDDVPKKRQKRQ